MNCNCQENNILCTQGTTCTLDFTFDTEIGTYTSAVFVVRKDYNTAPLITKVIEGLEGNSVNIVVDPEDTQNVTYENGKNQASYIWGLDFVDDVNNVRVNAFPQTGSAAPLFVVYKHVAEG